MIKRIIEFASDPARLYLKSKQLVIERDGYSAATVPMEDIGVLLISHHSVTISSGAMNGLLANNVAVIFCNERHMPAGLALPLEGNSVQTETMAMQIDASVTVKKRLWKEIVKRKIAAQADMLEDVGEENGALLAWAKEVRSGDPGNLEARAARFYWPRVFGKEFRRNRNGTPPNALLNYGYAIIRASVARALVGAGLHPSIGINHSNKYNSFCLADDLMEPLRPLVDKKVWQMWREEHNRDVKKDSKRELLTILTEPLTFRNRKEPFMEGVSYYAASFRRALKGKEKLLIPKW